jgi:hypothetical protein
VLHRDIHLKNLSRLYIYDEQFDLFLPDWIFICRFYTVGAETPVGGSVVHVFDIPQMIPLLGANDTNTSWSSSLATTPADSHSLAVSAADCLLSDSSRESISHCFKMTLLKVFTFCTWVAWHFICLVTATSANKKNSVL